MIAEVNLIEVKLKDPFLREFCFDLDRQKDFANFAKKGFFVAQEKITGDLHRNGAPALPFLTGHDIGHRGSQESLIIKTWMIVKAIVFCR